MGSLKIWLLETRPQFLLLDPVCVFTGVAASFYELHSINVLHLVLAFFGVLLSHIGVNVLNDYFDYKSGIDLRVKRTAFSGGSGILPSGLLEPRKVFLLGMVSLCLVIPIGIYFITVYKWAILPIGLYGVAVVYLYTPYITKLPGLTEILGPGLGCGLWVLGPYFTQTGGYSAMAVVVTAVAGLLIADLLLLNEFPDVEADRSAGRRHMPIVLGPEKAAKVYCLVLASAYALILAGAVAEILPLLALLGLGTLPLGIKAMKGALRYHSDIGALVPYLGTNVFVVLLTPLLMSIGILIWGFV